MSASTPAAASQGEPEPRLLNAAGLAELTALMDAMGASNQVIALERGKRILAHPMDPGSFEAHHSEGATFLEIAGSDSEPNGAGDFFLRLHAGEWHAVVRPGHSMDLMGAEGERYSFIFLEPSRITEAAQPLAKLTIGPVSRVIAERAKGNGVLVLHRRPHADVAAYPLPEEALSVTFSADRSQFMLAGADLSLTCRIGECKHAVGTNAVNLFVGEDHYTLWFVPPFLPPGA
jgi:hypothetical protein